MADGPLISLTVCMRNAEHWVDDCLRSLVKQTYRPLEIIAVDDGSTDGGFTKLESWAGEHDGINVTVLKQSPIGLSAGRNLALNIRRASGSLSLTSIAGQIRIGFLRCSKSVMDLKMKMYWL